MVSALGEFRAVTTEGDGNYGTGVNIRQVSQDIPWCDQPASR